MSAQQNPWMIHLLYLGLAVVVALALASNMYFFPLNERLAGGVCMTLLMTIAVASAVWMVLGPGEFWRRMLIGYFAVAILLVAFNSGLYFGQLPVGDQRGPFGLSVYSGMLFFAVFQIPFWFCRMVFGWRLAWKHENDAGQVPLANLFLFMVVVGLTIASAGVARSMLIHDSTNQLMIGDEHFVPSVENDGSIHYQAEMVTAENFELIRSQYIAEANWQTNRFGLIFSVLSILFATAAAPLTYFGFRFTTVAAGLLSSYLYAGLILAAIIAFGYFFLSAVLVELVLIAVCGLAITTFIFCIQLGLRSLGFHLSRRQSKSNAQRSQQDNVTVPGDELAPVAHPLD